MDADDLGKVYEVISEVAIVPLSDVVPSARLVEDLGMDSLEFAKMEQELQEVLELEIPPKLIEGAKTVGEVVEKLDETLYC